MASKLKKVQLQARLRSVISEETGLPFLRGKLVPTEADWIPVISYLVPELDAARFLKQNENNMIWEHRVVPASKALRSL